MKEYQKIKNVFEFDANYKSVLGYNEPFKTLKNLIWKGTEKIDGTNVRVYWDGHKVQLAGRTDKAQFPSNLQKYLEETFLTQEMEYIFEQVFEDKEVYLFGEGYGPKIQKDGEKYSSTPSFIIFDVNIDGYDLNSDNVDEVSSKLGLQSVPVVFEGTLDEAVEFMSKHPMSTLNDKHEMEGLVLVPKEVMLYDKKKEMIKCKCKYRDCIKR